MKKYIMTLAVVITSITGFYAKPRSVYLDKELSSASMVEYVEITNYTDSTIEFVTLDSNQVMTAKSNGAVTQGELFDKHTTGYWPIKGDQVLIVVGPSGYVSLFATIQNDHYRFWSPGFTGSTALFHFKKPAMKLIENDGLQNINSEYQTCWDGCLLPVNELNNLIKE
jgi:hypothetical protein